jgi:23S rRNA (adenine2503-C2)-methyltransferase
LNEKLAGENRTGGKLNKKDIKEFSRDKLASWFEENGIKPYRSGQIFKWIYIKNADSFDVMTDISKDLRKLLDDNFTLNRLEKKQIKTSKDGSKKYLFGLEDGRFIESVLIKEKNRMTLCISSQVGCALGCRFCLTGKSGLTRNLSTGEIIAQIRDIQKDQIGAEPVSNLVFMGMGEPLANYDNLITALRIISDTDYGFKYSKRRVTISTSGLVPNIVKLGHETDANLAISLNAVDNKTRDFLMPVNKKYPIEELLEACRDYPLTPRRKITFEYILIKDVNDSVENAKKLIKILEPVKAKINLIPFNEFTGSEFRRPPESTVLKFQNILHNNGYTTIVRRSKGQDILAACGQLSAENL